MARITIALVLILVLQGCGESPKNDQGKSSNKTLDASTTTPSRGDDPSNTQGIDRDNDSDNAALTTSMDETKGSKAEQEKDPSLDRSADKSDEVILRLLQELEESLAQIDDSKVMDAYGEDGSAIQIVNPSYALLGDGFIAINELTRSTPLRLDDSKALLSDSVSIGGATSIVSDPTGFGFSVALSGDYLFEFDEFKLSSQAQESLESIWSLYQKNDGTSILIEGHTDSKGNEDYNLTLSVKRASSVKSWFLNKGVSADLITTIGHGESKPIEPNTLNGEDNPEGRALNRRVNISIKTEKQVSS